ncbi:type IX secretion system membrane protein PorP/SprF [Flagellimonas sp. HMM57]|uniref:PorP/SprF family type IX secretion system membrane protein n=1 Tax=unclassified Flagellimonas TaxID=2644544 RepID=UPI0013D52BC9|nr:MULTISPECIES: type IX secretion system membrane protein PorP/SprF [unclassified Flagellimonas]UII75340.1 type IX secretion system membrane protein PorP/SprF [Flagellimonas sp. HMM57]
MKHLILVLGLAITLGTKSIFAQQDPQYTFYRYSMNLINPAFAGSSEGAELTLGLRSQWAGVQGAPESQSALFSMPVGANVGLGVSILNDQTFIENQTWVAIDFSYRVKLNEDYMLYFGLKASGNSYSANTTGLITYGVGQDGTLMDFENRFTPNIGAGVYLKNEDFFLSLSAPKLMTPDRLEERNGNAFSSTDRRHVYLSGGYDFKLGKNMNLLASSMLRYVDASPISVDLTSILDFGQRFKVGASYRLDEALSGMFMFDISSGLQIGYAYEAAMENDINNIDNSSHELFMRLTM